MRKICNLVIKYSLYGLVFLMPLFWLSWTVEAYEFNKQYLLVFLVGLALLAWLAKMIIVQKKVVFRRTPLDIWILIFMVVMILSAVFSVDKISSWFGFYGRFSDSVVGLLAMGVMYFVVVNNLMIKSKAARSDVGSSDEEIESQGQPLDANTGLIPKEEKEVFGAEEISQGNARKGILSLDKILKLFLASVWLVVIVTYLSIFGFWGKIPGLPQMMSFKSFNPMSNSLEGLAIFLVAVISLVIGMILSSKTALSDMKSLLSREAEPQEESLKTKAKSRLKSQNFFHFLLLLITVVLLFLIDFWPAWLTLGIVMLILLITALWTRLFKKRVNLLILPIILVLISVAGLTGSLAKIKGQSGSEFLATPLPQEVILDYQVANQVTWQTLKEYPIFGSGPGTFLAGFTEFKPAEFNQNRFWNIRFNKGPSHLMEKVGTTGLLGILSYLVIIVIFLLIVFLSLWKLRKGSKLSTGSKSIALPLFLSWLALFTAQFVYLENTALGFFFWLFMGLGIVSWQGIQAVPYRKLSFSFKKLPEVGLVINIVLLILVFALAGLFYLGGRFYWADAKFRQPAADNEQIVRNVEKTVNLNKYRENYRRALSQIYLINAWAEARKPAEEQNIQLLQALAAGSIQQARLATSLSPNLVMAWENLGTIYRDSRGLVGGTLPFALDSFAKASELEPTNPFFYRELCRINLISEERDWDETIGYCQEAIDLKPNYLDAHIQLALVYEQKGDLEEALNQLKGTLDRLKGVSFQRGSALAGAAAEIYFQLGRVHFNLGQVDEAVKMFEQSVIVMPQYANARYALALSYQAKGRNEDALIQFQIINQLVPGNENIEAMIGQLQGQLQPSSSLE
jgi:tetratricopeptide (TPR) repeat protein